ncbi:MAG: hypothetical protein HY584_05645 [Candidatus Omnitrophica bacterium]|nr:hypothetical protein [Candidatus Omnitrophota bacterium]
MRILRVWFRGNVLFFVAATWVLAVFSLAFAEEFRYDTQGRDPFLSPMQNLSGGEWSRGELKLEGIILDRKGKSFAIVNGEIVQEGQTLEGFQLTKVEKNRVFLEKDQESFEIILHEDNELRGRGVSDPSP